MGGERVCVQRKLLTWRLEELLMDESAADEAGPRQGAAFRQRQPIEIVASLIDKPSNLGGICRTGEVSSACMIVYPTVSPSEQA